MNLSSSVFLVAALSAATLTAVAGTPTPMFYPEFSAAVDMVTTLNGATVAWGQGTYDIDINSQAAKISLVVNTATDQYPVTTLTTGIGSQNPVVYSYSSVNQGHVTCLANQVAPFRNPFEGASFGGFTVTNATGGVVAAFNNVTFAGSTAPGLYAQDATTGAPVIQTFHSDGGVKTTIVYKYVRKLDALPGTFTPPTGFPCNKTATPRPAADRDAHGRAARFFASQASAALREDRAAEQAAAIAEIAMRGSIELATSLRP